ncbi:hypothetical protein Shel_28550 [Slackia heliotrinireducens DSM 20476]|uniref:Uncharacterized protein n=1 Tax=Slackia heliotrinireducens (strain ATCC 29202 / DSM 20476 / NCTC 11029 / RHS 1) TaxID=471855 RepID=C7N4A5_SLAHD|nr:hypothetical protein Shel_28550 [Slackia heliotrinireducens DSM 20476]
MEKVENPAFIRESSVDNFLVESGFRKFSDAAENIFGIFLFYFHAFDLVFYKFPQLIGLVYFHPMLKKRTFPRFSQSNPC